MIMEHKVEWIGVRDNLQIELSSRLRGQMITALSKLNFQILQLTIK